MSLQSVLIKARESRRTPIMERTAIALASTLIAAAAIFGVTVLVRLSTATNFEEVEEGVGN
jgi:hypothetical protein